jgi:two-component system, cell cycle sensor histidine kinase and response regulator CckA
MATPLNALIVEDSANDAVLLVHALSSAGFELQWKRVETEPEYVEGLKEGLDIVFSDFTLPQFSVQRALELLVLKQLDVPFIIVSGTIGEERAVESLKAGATDYVLKDGLGRLGQVVRRALGEVKERFERRKAQQALRASEERFRQAQKMESIGQLAGGVAHDFNNILTVIQGHATLLLNETLAEEARESAEQIALAAERAASLTSQLLTFSRKQVMQFGAIDLDGVVGNLTRMLRRLLGEQIALDISCASNQARVWADVSMMEQVLMNLAVNARDAMPKGGRLSIRTTEETIEEHYVKLNPQGVIGRHICLAVSDTGCGIGPETMPRLFEPFFTTKGVGKGTGLGLATVYGIVKQHRGWVTVYSELNKGTVFRVYLPVVAAETEVEKRVEQTEVRGGSETILLTEDEAPLRALVRNVLERHGYEVLEAASGAQALKVWRKHRERIALVLTDMVMPDTMTGRELVERLRLERPSLPAIFTSGYSADVVGKDFELLDGINFLQKPYPLRKLLHAVREALNQPPIAKPVRGKVRRPLQ